MDYERIGAEDARKLEASEMAKRLVTDLDKGLTGQEASDREKFYGKNTIESKSTPAWLEFLSFFWGPIPWTIEAAAILSALVRHWSDLIIISLLLVFNAVIGFLQRSKAEKAVDALREKLALKALALRDGKWQQVRSADLVPGDMVRIQAGNILPADVKLVDGDFLSVDQSSLTGESMLVMKENGDICYSGVVAKKGSMKGLVYATGRDTYFGKTAELVSEASAKSHFNRAILSIGKALIFISVALAVVLVAVMLIKGSSFLTLLQFALILVVASIPAALPAVLTVIMSRGAVTLAKAKAVVTHLESIEEMAGMDVLCSDKTGTLTRNQLSLSDPYLVEAKDEEELMLAAAVASEDATEDPIDKLMVGAVKDKKSLADLRRNTEHFQPFDPVNKRSEALVDTPEGKELFVKGAPQVIADLMEGKDEEVKRVKDEITELASGGLRTLGVARKQEGSWHFLGLVTITDPLRADARKTIESARNMGVGVKMITGDNVAIARKVGKELGLSKEVFAAGDAFKDVKATDSDTVSADLSGKIARADIFAEVFPEHKYTIVKALQAQGHIVGMTGDGVNDAPALKQADTGIAVKGATDAAQAAAGVVLTSEGIGVVIQTIEEARRIFEKMNSYAIYRITESIRIMFFVVFAMVAFGFYPITAVMIILLALLNDVPIMTLASDNVRVSASPVRWNTKKIIRMAWFIGIFGVFETSGLLLLGRNQFHLDQASLQTLIFLKLAVAGHMTLFVTRTKGRFWKRPYPSAPLLWSAIGTKLVVTLIAGFGFGLVKPLDWWYVGATWAYCFFWMFPLDGIKCWLYRRFEREANPKS
ncbi:plasma-membrane proton-efflux P-type ATPase (plasmid) [Fulvitalea axinellae]|uniref:Plasma-membrane proton-efflux P-type ATPase n=1 Tax=Fulvitalea axinellae TaxID=1182444 RepID=A0AAU9CUV6_9BACT|nr:plasma-membrane proton-efflux P-type ATPase [Fulvitalea axinellae]